MGRTCNKGIPQLNSKNIVLAALLLFLITLEVLIALDYIARQDDLRNQRTTFYKSVIALENQIGYVGLIHNFKNAILRPDDVNYSKKTLVNYREALKQVETIEKSGSLILGLVQMPDTRAMLDAYRSRIERLPELLSQNLSIREIDNLLRYDDEPSHAEIAAVASNVTLKLEGQISSLLTSRLRLALITLLVLLLTLAGAIRFFFKEQQAALAFSQRANAELEQYKEESMRSQNALLSLMEDVKHKTQQTSELNSQLVIKNREMEQFIYTVSHDLKSPLVTIAGFTHKVIKEFDGDPEGKQVHRLNRIKENVFQMETLLSELLDLSKIVQQKIEKTNVDVNLQIEKQLGLLEASINESKAIITVQNNLPYIYANERLLEECIQNLLTNAINYRDKERELKINIWAYASTLPNSKIPATSLVIEDNGIGIAPKYQQLVFAIFERLDKGQGSGVGLTIVKTVMDKHNGLVELQSEENAGCRFTLTFADQEDGDDAEA